MNDTLDKIRLLLWKNWVLQKRRRKKLMIDLLIPMFIGAFLIYVRYAAPTEKQTQPTKFTPFTASYIPPKPSNDGSNDERGYLKRVLQKLLTKNLGGQLSTRVVNQLKNSTLDKFVDIGSLLGDDPGNWTAVWSPNQTHVNSVMEKVCKKINVEGMALNNASTLERVMTTASELFPKPRGEILAGVVFPDNIINDSEIPLDLKIKIRFPGESRFPNTAVTGAIPRNWLTGLIFPLIQIPGPRDLDNQGGAPGYYREGFLAIQDAVSSSLLEYRLNSQNRTHKLNILLQNYPYGNYVRDPLLFVMQNILPFLIVLSFLFSVNTMVEKITTEKETKLTVIMNVMGLSKSLRWSAWCIYSFAFFLILISVLIIAFKVPFVGERSVFPYSDWSCLLLFLVCFAFAAITYSFLISTIFAKASVASIVAGMAWFLMFVPFYIIQQKYGEISMAVKCLSSLLLNTGMGVGFHIILMHEGVGTGAQWNNLTVPATPDDDMTLALLMLILVFDGLVHLCLALYIESVFPGEYETPLPWYYPCQRSYWFRNKANTSAIEDETSTADAEVDYPLEDEPKNLAAGIQIKNLRKVYNTSERAAVKNLNLNAYEGEITVLMGFNGAGKTTTLSILTGIYTATSGTASIAGYDIKSNMREARKHLGFCPQYNILFQDLNVEEHIYFFGRLKGLSKEEIDKETAKYLDLLNLNDKRRTLAKHLSGGMKRKLSVSLAMCGDTKVLLFDEPTAGMDPRARRSLWDLLISEKKGRSILITTHHLDEADVLGDRVAIMSEGKLSCYGSTFFLKKRFACGYRLIIVRRESCIKEKIDEVIRNYIPDVISSHVVGMEMFYRLSEEYSHKFEELFKAIEARKEELHVISFGVSPTSLEDVFMRIAAEVNAESQEIQKIEEEFSLQKQANGPDKDIKVNVMDNCKVTGNQLIQNQISAMSYKLVRILLQSWKYNLVLIIMTVCGLSASISTIRINSKLFNLPPRILDLQDFRSGIVAVQARDDCSGLCHEYLNDYIKIVQMKQMKVVKLNSSCSMDEYLIDICEKDVEVYRTKHILATRFEGSNVTKITCWFNGLPYHTPAIALSTVYNALLRAILEFNATTTFINEPLPYEDETKANIEGSGLGSGFQISLFIAFSYVFVASSFVTFPIHERQVKAKLLQFVSGINNFTFWAVAFIWDLVKAAGPNIALLVAMAAFQEEGFKEPEELGYTAVVVFSFFVSALPLTYLGSLIFKKPAIGFVQTTFFHIITGIYSAILVMILKIPLLELTDVADVLDWVFSIFPLYAMGQSLQSVDKVSKGLKMCKPIYEHCLKNEAFIHVCCKEPKQCPPLGCMPWTESMWDWELPGFGRYISFMFISGLTYFVILFTVEYGIFNFFKYRINRAATESQTDEKDSDVEAEREKIVALTEESKKNYNLLIDGLTKKFKKYTAVNNLYLSVSEGECFGLLGANGAGKTTTFRILTGDEYPSSGSAYVKGLNIRSDMKKIYKNIGYCPQFDALFDDLTGREHLRLYGLIRGIPSADIHEMSVNFARELLFEQYLDKKVKEYSGGNKRKLSTALALIGNPPIVYLDEPTAGIDPVAKRHLWAVISKLRAQGTTIILTSHSMEECEALCTRLAIMVKGEFKCIGTTQYLKNKYCQGYSLAVKVKRQRRSSHSNNNSHGDAGNPKIEEDNKPNDSTIQDVKNFIAANFKGSIQLEQHEDVMVYRIPSSGLPWSKMFGIIESSKNKLCIEDYTLGQTTLEQIILMFTQSDLDI